eukprot:775857-Amphidinium_carterae.1
MPKVARAKMHGYSAIIQLYHDFVIDNCEDDSLMLFDCRYRASLEKGGCPLYNSRLVLEWAARGKTDRMPLLCLKP